MEFVYKHFEILGAKSKCPKFYNAKWIMSIGVLYIESWFLRDDRQTRKLILNGVYR